MEHEIAVTDVQFQGTFPVLGIDESGSCLHDGLLLLEFFHIMITDDILKARFLHLTLHGHEHNETFIAFRMLRALGSRQQRIELHGDQLGVDHFVLGCAGMDVEAVDVVQLIV